ncbi:MAG TPA: FtsX-like permease family protein [Thermoanaerobaculia bacterium]
MHIGPVVRAMNHNRTRVTLIILEIAITLAIVTNCVNVILAERAKMATRSGFEDTGIVRLHTRPFVPEFQDEAFIRTTVDADLQAIEGVPGVEAVANTSFQLWEGGGSSTEIRPAGSSSAPVRTQIYYGSQNITQSLGATVSEGRPFAEGEHGSGSGEESASVVIISRALAEALFPGQPAAGRSIEFVTGTGEATGDPYAIVGVMERFFNPFGMPGADPDPFEERGLFYPQRAGSYAQGLRYLIRVSDPGDMAAIITEIERRIVEVNPGRVVEFEPVSEKKARWFATSSLMVTTMTFIIAMLVIISALGLIGITALSVAERTRQIGTRRALGATRADILRHFLIENAIITAAGLALGIVATYALNVFLVANLVDAKMPPMLILFGIALLLLNAIVATLPPAFRAMGISPAVATKSI